MKKILIYITCLITIFTCFGCNFMGENSNKVSSISISQTQIDLKINQTYQLSATVLPSNATNKGVKWESTNTNVSTVSNGYVMAKSIGSAYIKVISLENTSIYDYCLVKVQGDYNLTINYSAPFSITHTGSGMYPTVSTMTVTDMTYKVETVTSGVRITIYLTMSTDRGFLLKYSIYDEQNIKKYSSSSTFSTNNELASKKITALIEYDVVPSKENYRVVFS